MTEISEKEIEAVADALGQDPVLGSVCSDGNSSIKDVALRLASTAVHAAAHARAEAVGVTVLDVVEDANHWFDCEHKNEPDEVRALAIKLAVDRGGQTCPVSDYDVVRAREIVTGEIKEIDRLRRELASALAHPAVPEGWRPIETAPENDHALFYVGDDGVYLDCLDRDGALLAASGDERIFATHWMPLPKPPVAAAEKEAR